MKEEDYIADRTLERLRLGELSEDESQRVLDALEAQGQMHRLEELIEDDERIREKYPPAMMAARARDELRRRERQSERERRDLEEPALFAPGVRIFAVVATLMLVASFTVYTAYFAQEPEYVGMARPVDLTLSESLQEDSDDGEEVFAQPWKGMLAEWVKTSDPSKRTPMFICAESEKFELDMTGMKRVTIDRASVVSFAVDEGEDTLVVECTGRTSAVATFHTDAQPLHMTFRVVPEYPEEFSSPECDAREAEARVLIDRAGRVESVHVAGRIDESTQTCIRDHFEALEWSESEENWRVAIWRD